MSTTFPRRADAVRGGELSHSSARSREFNSDCPEAWLAGYPCRNGTRTAGEVCCDMLFSPKKPAIGAPIAMARTAAIKSLFVCIDKCLSGAIETQHEAPQRRVPALPTP